MRNRTFTTALTAVLGFASIASGASGAEYEGSGFLLWLFIGLGSIVVAFQFIPGLVMLYSMLKGILVPAAKEQKAAGK